MRSVPTKVQHIEIREHIELAIGPNMDSVEIAGFLKALRTVRPDRHFYVDRELNCIMSKPRRDA